MKKTFVLFLLVTGAWGCSRKIDFPYSPNDPRFLPWKEYKARFSNEMPLLNRFDNWVINDIDGYREYIDAINFTCHSKDTVFDARYKGGVTYDPLYEKWVLRETVRYSKGYDDAGYHYYMTFDDKWDLKYATRSKILSTSPRKQGREESVVGWYSREYERENLPTIGQWRYFAAHEDSLKLIPGDSLRPLPEISLKEFKRMMKTQGKSPGKYASSSSKKLDKYYQPTPYND